MKKIFTLFALLTCFLGANAKEVVDLEIDYSTVTAWNGGWMSDAAAERVSIQDGAIYFHSEATTENLWDVQFQLPGVQSLDNDAMYTITLKIKGSVEQPIHGGFSGSNNVDIPVTTDWKEVVLEGLQNNPSAQYFANSGSLLIQCGDYVGDWWISYIKITHEERDNQRPVEWVEILSNGDAEQPWGDLANVAYNDQENNFKVCAWSKEKGHNLNDDGGWDPFPASIEEVDGSHVFVCHGQLADTEGDASSWDNQFWIEAPKKLRNGMEYKVSFRYKASENATTDTQMHHQNPSNYAYHNLIGQINFTTEWQTFEGSFIVGDADGWSIAFNLNSQNKNAIDFYFDDLSIQEMKLDEGWFIASSNTATGIEYDFDNAIEFEDGGDGTLIATVGTAGKPDTWVNEVMISTIRGKDSAFKSGTIKPTGAIQSGDEFWTDYTEGSNAKIKLPAAGVWQITLDLEFKSVNFVQIEGDTPQGPIEINPNTTEVVLKGLERDDLADSTNPDGTVTIREEEGGTGQAWDNQFWIMANRTLDSGEVTLLEFDYVATKEAKVTTQCHKEAGNYLHWQAIGDVNFTTEVQHFSTTFTVPSEANGMQSIAFNMAEIREACDYTIKNVVWKTEDGTESLINMTGSDNFYVKEGSTDSPHVFGSSNDKKPGDINEDGEVNVSDAVTLISYVAKQDFSNVDKNSLDLNGDGNVDVTDVVVLILMIGSAN